MGGPREGSDFQNLHRNKRCITLNLKSPEGVAVLKKMAAKADVVVENYRPDVKKRLGIDYEALSAVNPRLIYASISGFGQDGPYANRPGFDQIAQGMGGLMSITGLPGQGPVRVGIPVADLTAGLFAAMGIMVALLEREQSGKGQAIDTSLLQAQIFMLDFQATRWLTGGEVPPQAGNNHPTSIPTGVFKTSDGYINIAAAGQKMWERGLRDARRSADVAKHPDYATGAARSKNRDALNAVDGKRNREEHQRALGRRLQQGRRAVRADLFDRPGVRRRAGQASRHRQGRPHAEARRRSAGRPAGVAVAHAERDRGAAADARRAHRRDPGRVRLRQGRDQEAARGEDALSALERYQESETDMNEMAKTDKVLSRKEGGVGYVVFNNPERHNAMSLDMWAATGPHHGRFRERRLRCACVVLTGAGSKAFVSGADISRFGAERSNEEAVAHYNATVEKASLALHTYPKPTIAMIRGYCIGGGLGIAMCCDLRIATEQSTFAVPAAKLGLGYGHAGVKRLIDVVGPSFTKEIFYTARQFNAEEAKTMGLVNRVVPDAELESYVKKYAETIAGNAPLTIKALKNVVGELVKDESKRDVAGMEAVVNACFKSKDYIEGRDAFMEKRKPVFTGS